MSRRRASCAYRPPLDSLTPSVSSHVLIFHSLADVRFPLIHYPPALAAYVAAIRPKKKVVIVLTKTDLVPRWLSEAWKKWFEEREGPDGASVVLMESYRETERTELTQGSSYVHKSVLEGSC